MNDQQRSIPLGAVGRFFFTPTDPTTLGFMRIMTGLLLLYVHGVYSLDLKTFMGPHAWWDQEAANAQRREAPHIPTPFGWRLFEPTISFDDAFHRRAAELKFLRNLPEDVDQRRAKVRFLGRIFALTPMDVGDGLYLCNSVGRLADGQEDKVRAALRMPTVPDENLPLTIPEFIRRLPPSEREVAFDEAIAFNHALPDDPEEQEFIFTWLGNFPHHRRPRLHQFLAGDLVEDGKNLSLPSSPEERAAFLDYAERWGIDIRQPRHKGTAVFSQWYHLKEAPGMWGVHVAALGVFFLFTIGLWTRVTSVMTWALTLTYIQRGQISLFGQDTMQTLLVTYLMVGQCGAALSIDALLRRFRATRAQITQPGKRIVWAEEILAGPRKEMLANLAIRLVQINYCLIYASSGISKLKGTTWWEHSAGWLVLANAEFGPVRYQAYEWLLRVMVEYRFVVAAIAAMITLYTFVVELCLPLLIWTRLRPYFVAGAVLLHLGIAVIMGLNVFALFMFALLLCYFPARLIRERVGYSPGMGKKMTLHFDSRNPKSVRKASLIRAVDVANQVTLVDDAGKKELSGTVRLTLPEGQTVSGKELYDAGLKELVLLRPVRWLGKAPGVWTGINLWASR